jgi:hypothetical protein
MVGKLRALEWGTAWCPPSITPAPPTNDLSGASSKTATNRVRAAPIGDALGDISLLSEVASVILVKETAQ